MNSLKVWLANDMSWFTMPTVSITITDVLEIFILAFLVYSLLLWIKNTRAWTLLKGLMVLVVCVSLVYILHMDTLIFIVNRGIDIAITAAIVIFQPELRRALEQIGEKQIVSSLIPIDTGRDVTERFSDKTVNEIAKAASEMGKAKTGALMNAAVELGCIAADCSDEVQREAFMTYAGNIGMTFQIIDDLLDVYGDMTLGKPLGSDEKNGKNTYLTFTSPSAAEQDAKRLTQEAKDAIAGIPGTAPLAELADKLLHRKK